MESQKYKCILKDLKSKVKLYEPDNTFYEEVKGVSLVEGNVFDLPSSDIAIPSLLNLSDEHKDGWKIQHAPLIEAAFNNQLSCVPFRSIFPGPFIPTLEEKMILIGDTAFTVFQNIIENIKQRIPEMKKLMKNSGRFYYKSDYKPITRKIAEPEEAWNYKRIKCPVVHGVNFPLPPTYEFEPSDIKRIKTILNEINRKCWDFCVKHIGRNKKRSKKDILAILSYLNSIQYLFKKTVSANLVEAYDEVLKSFDKKDIFPKHPAKFLFEIEHALSYLIAIKDFHVISYGKYGTFWVDILKLPLENLVETELCDIQRVLREIRTFFTLGWSPIIVHFDGKLGYNIDGTHRHYALLTIELLRRLRKAYHKKGIRKIDLNSTITHKVISDFKLRYQKEGLSLRETLRVVNYLINSDSSWSYLEDFELELDKILNLEFRYVPVIYLPEWRARSVVKNLCDKGIAMVGVPPENIYIVGRSKGKKGIFIRGGYHGTDRQPMVWMNLIELQKI